MSTPRPIVSQNKENEEKKNSTNEKLQRTLHECLAGSTRRRHKRARSCPLGSTLATGGAPRLPPEIVQRLVHLVLRDEFCGKLATRMGLVCREWAPIVRSAVGELATVQPEHLSSFGEKIWQCAASTCDVRVCVKHAARCNVNSSICARVWCQDHVRKNQKVSQTFWRFDPWRENVPKADEAWAAARIQPDGTLGTAFGCRACCRGVFFGFQIEHCRQCDQFVVPVTEGSDGCKLGMLCPIHQHACSTRGCRGGRKKVRADALVRCDGCRNQVCSADCALESCSICDKTVYCEACSHSWDDRDSDGDASSSSSSGSTSVREQKISVRGRCDLCQARACSDCSSLRCSICQRGRGCHNCMRVNDNDGEAECNFHAERGESKAFAPCGECREIIQTNDCAECSQCQRDVCEKCQEEDECRDCLGWVCKRDNAPCLACGCVRHRECAEREAGICEDCQSDFAGTCADCGVAQRRAVTDGAYGCKGCLSVWCDRCGWARFVAKGAILAPPHCPENSCAPGSVRSYPFGVPWSMLET